MQSFGSFYVISLNIALHSTLSYTHTTTLVMTKVFYVHYEGDALNFPSSYTRRFSLSDNENTTVNDILDSFSYNFNEWNSSFSLLRSTLTFITESGRKISNNRRLSDIVVVDDTNDFCIKGSCEKKTLSSEQTSNNQTQSKSINSRDTNQTENIDEIKARAKEMFNNKQYRHTRVICEAALKNFQSTQNKRISVDMIVFLKYLAEIKLENGNGSSAITYIRKALDIATKQSYSSYDLNIILIRALIVEKEYDDALTVLNSVLLTLANDSSQLEALALKAEVLFELGRVSEAGDTINRCITPPLAPAEGSGTMALSNIPVLVSYAYISMSCQPPLIEQPLSALLKALSVHVDNKKVRLYLAKLLNLGYSADCSRKDMEDGRGVKELFRQVSSRESTAPAYALLSAVCKDHSAMRPCIRLMETALNLQPMNTSYALSLMHAHEVVGDFDAALTVLLHFCERNSTVSVKLPIQINTDDSSSICQAPEMSCADLIRALTDSTAVLDANAKSIYEFRWSGDSTNLYLHAENAALDSAEPLINMNAAVSFARDFVDSELDLLALGFTAVKILFLQGKLSRLPGLFALLEPLRCYSRKQLHETMIRNEHAYYQSIGQILAHRSAVYFQRRQSQAPLEVRPLVDVGTNNQRISGLEKLFVCGDSHCLSSAWSELTVVGKKRLVVPKLVTGVKQWHLRKEGDFYPKANFSCAIDSIPNGSEVVLSLGEIDCREGMLLAVERDKYDSVEEAMRTTLQLFMQVLTNLVKRKAFKIYVHPVPSVLKETRHLVLAYNILYEQAVKALPSAYAGRIKWLDFFSDLLKPNELLSQCLPSSGPRSAAVPLALGADRLGAELQLKEEFVLDGTHLSPAYTSLLKESIERLQ